MNEIERTTETEALPAPMPLLPWLEPTIHVEILPCSSEKMDSRSTFHCSDDVVLGILDAALQRSCWLGDSGPLSSFDHVGSVVCNVVMW